MPSLADSQVLGDTDLSNEAKKMRIAGMVSTIVLTQQASQNYEQVMEQQEGQANQYKENNNMKERMKRWCAVAVLLMGLSLFTAVAYGVYLLGGVYAAVGYLGWMPWWASGCFGKSPEHHDGRLICYQGKKSGEWIDCNWKYLEIPHLGRLKTN